MKRNSSIGLKGSESLRQVFSSLFKDMDDSSIDEMIAASQQIELEAGEYLFHQGEESKVMFFVLTGRLRAIADKDGKSKILGDIAAGEPIGEFAFFTGEPRMAAALAIRRSTLLEITPKTYLNLVSRNPELGSSITRMIINRLQRNAFEQNKSSPPKNIALIHLQEDEDLSSLSIEVEKHFRSQKQTVQFYDNYSIPEKDLDSFFDTIEQHSGTNILICHKAQKLWSHQCILYADLVVVVANFAGDPSITSFEQELDLYAHGLLNKKVYLLLVHPANAPLPSNTSRWLQNRSADLHIHFRENHHADLRRFCRIISNKAFGLVLGGGGAKGFAHIGVVKALLEKNIEVDFIGGTSAGALYGIGMCFADFDFEKIQHIAAEGVRQKLTSNDFTLPVISMMTGNKFKKYLQSIYGDYEMEDTWVNCFCVSANYSKAKAHVHDSGPIWKQVQASIAIPGVFPPVVIDQHLHVDGGVMDNLPIVPMYRYPVDSIFAVSLSGLSVREVDFLEAPSAWQLMRDKLRKKKRYSIPGIASILTNSLMLNSTNKQAETKGMVSHYFELNLKGVSLMEDKRWKEIGDKGYEQAKDYLDSVEIEQ